MSTSPEKIAKPQPAAEFPLGICLGGIVMTWAGLSAAALGVKWGAGRPAGDALPLAWNYVQVMQLVASALLWPALALRRSPAFLLRRDLCMQAAALGAGTLPSLIVAAFCSAVSGRQIAAALAVQGGVMILVMGVLHAERRARNIGVTLIASWIVTGPVATFVWNNFFPRAWNGWVVFLPALAVMRAADAAIADGWMLGGLCAVMGLALLCLPQSNGSLPDGRSSDITASGGAESQA